MYYCKEKGKILEEEYLCNINSLMEKKNDRYVYNDHKKI